MRRMGLKIMTHAEEALERGGAQQAPKLRKRTRSAQRVPKRTREHQREERPAASYNLSVARAGPHKSVKSRERRVRQGPTPSARHTHGGQHRSSTLANRKKHLITVWRHH